MGTMTTGLGHSSKQLVTCVSLRAGGALAQGDEHWGQAGQEARAAPRGAGCPQGSPP